MNPPEINRATISQQKSSDNLEVRLFCGGAAWLAVMAPAIFVEIQSGQITEPSVVLNRTVAQSLMNQLWECDIRPRQFTPSDNLSSLEAANILALPQDSDARLGMEALKVKLTATERHLMDMRAVAFGAPMSK